MNTLNIRHKSKFTSRRFGLAPSSGVQIKCEMFKIRLYVKC